MFHGAPKKGCAFAHTSNYQGKIMKTLLIALTLTAASSAFAAGDTQEATPYTNSKAQAHGE